MTCPCKVTVTTDVAIQDYFCMLEVEVSYTEVNNTQPCNVGQLLPFLCINMQLLLVYPRHNIMHTDAFRKILPYIIYAVWVPTHFH